MAYWLLTSAPPDVSCADGKHEGQTVWEGISNALALRHLRAMKAGDGALFSQTGQERASVGTATVASDASPGPLPTLKKEREFHGSALLRLPGLSLLPVRPAQWKVVNALSK